MWTSPVMGPRTHYLLRLLEFSRDIDWEMVIKTSRHLFQRNSKFLVCWDGSGVTTYFDIFEKDFHVKIEMTIRRCFWQVQLQMLLEGMFQGYGGGLLIEEYVFFLLLWDCYSLELLLSSGEVRTFIYELMTEVGSPDAYEHFRWSVRARRLCRSLFLTYFISKWL